MYLIKSRIEATDNIRSKSWRAKAATALNAGVSQRRVISEHKMSKVHGPGKVLVLRVSIPTPQP